MESLHNPAPKSNKLRTALSVTLALILLFFASKYYFTHDSGIDKKDFPEGFSYRIIKEDTAQNVHGYVFQNEILVELSEKINKEQITILAKELYDKKHMAERPDYRFLIGYVLPGNASDLWARSDFSPNFEVNIFGSNPEQDLIAQQLADTAGGKIIGKWREGQQIPMIYLLTKRDSGLFVKTISVLDLSSDEYEVDALNFGGNVRYYRHWEESEKYFIWDSVTNGILYSPNEKPGYIINNKPTEYLVINEDSALLFYNGENVNFAKGTKF